MKLSRRAIKIGAVLLLSLQLLLVLQQAYGPIPLLPEMTATQPLGVGQMPTSTPQPTPTPTPTTTPVPPTDVQGNRVLPIYSGPGQTFEQIDSVPADITVRVTERNLTGNWVRIVHTSAETDPVAGWVMTGYLQQTGALQLSEVPVNHLVSDADPSAVEEEEIARLYAAPVIPQIHVETVETIFNIGQALGNEPDVITKIGDSVTADPIYLSPMSFGDYRVGPYDFLAETIDTFGPSMAENSIAARQSLNTFSVLDPFWADDAYCEPNASPLTCEYHLKQPSIAFIMFGPNDIRGFTEEQFDGQMRKILDTSIEMGVIPVLSTFSYDPESEEFGPESVAFNLILIDLATEYQIPLINLWAAASELPARGLERDNIHMKHYGSNLIRFDGSESWSGVSLRNLLSVRVLYDLQQILDIRADDTAPEIAEAVTR